MYSVLIVFSEQGVSEERKVFNFVKMKDNSWQRFPIQVPLSVILYAMPVKVFHANTLE